jgi:serine/threonine protein kinase
MIISHKYEVQDQLGQGSMGVVYKMRHMALETISALKVLPTHLMGNPELVKRFYREARVMARLNHPNIVRVIDIHRDDDLQFYYFVMEYIQGQNLRQYLQERGALSLREVIEITRQVARALDSAHSHNPPVIHREVAPHLTVVASDQPVSC